MKEYDITANDLPIIRDHGVAVEATVTEARDLIDELVEADGLIKALDEAQGAVFTESAGIAFVIIKIIPDKK
jgi:hypothetical protein